MIFQHPDAERLPLLDRPKGSQNPTGGCTWSLTCRPLKGTGRKQESALASIIFQETILSFWVCVHVGIFVWVLWSPFWGGSLTRMSKMARNRSPEKRALATPKRLALTTRTEENLKESSKINCLMQICFWRQLLSDLYSYGTLTVCVSNHKHGKYHHCHNHFCTSTHVKQTCHRTWYLHWFSGFFTESPMDI